MIRKARQQDVRFIHGLLSRYGAEGQLLARPLTDIYEFLRDFMVAEDQKGQPVGSLRPASGVGRPVRGALLGGVA
jgi:amino-acid N-acetyltransferase